MGFQGGDDWRSELAPLRRVKGKGRERAEGVRRGERKGGREGRGRTSGDVLRLRRRDEEGEPLPAPPGCHCGRRAAVGLSPCPGCVLDGNGRCELHTNALNYICLVISPP